MNRTLVIIGVVFLALGILANLYTVVTKEKIFFGMFEDTETTTPYDEYTVPLFVVAIILILIGALVKKNSGGT